MEFGSEIFCTTTTTARDFPIIAVQNECGELSPEIRRSEILIHAERISSHKDNPSTASLKNLWSNYTTHSAAISVTSILQLFLDPLARVTAKTCQPDTTLKTQSSGCRHSDS